MKRILLFLSTFALLIFGWMVFLRMIPPAPDANWIEAIYRAKEARANSIEGPRIFLIGGSSVQFSLSAELATQATGRQFVNFGSHAGLGVDYILSRARRELRDGDIAVLSIEYHLPSLMDGQITSSQTMYEDWRYIIDAHFSSLPGLLFGVGPKQVVRSQIGRRFPGAIVGNTSDSYGDETRNNKPPGQAQLQAQLNAVKASATVIGVGYGAGTPHQGIQSFISWCKDHNITVIFIPPVLYVPDKYKPSIAQAEVDQRVNGFYAQFGAITPAHIADYYLPLEEMWDTTSHANDVGRRRATAMLIRDFCGVISCPLMQSHR